MSWMKISIVIVNLHLHYATRIQLANEEIPVAGHRKWRVFDLGIGRGKVSEEVFSAQPRSRPRIFIPIKNEL